MQLRYDTAYTGHSRDTVLRLVPNAGTWSAALIYRNIDLTRVWPKAGEGKTGKDGKEGNIGKFLASNRFSLDHFSMTQVDETEYDNYILDQAEKILTPGEVVYFVSIDKMNRIKIGITNDMVKRHVSLRCVIPFTLNVLAVANISHAEERKIQSLFSDVDLNNEWFELTPAIEDYITSLKQKQAKLPHGDIEAVESLPIKNYLIYQDKRSVIDKDATITETVGLRCPRCKDNIGIMRNMDTRKCSQCGLRIHANGENLLCTII